MFWDNHKNEKDRIGSLPIYRFPPPAPAKKEFNAMFELLKDDVIYISDSIYTMNGVFDYRRDVFDDERKMLGSISDSHFYKTVKYHLV